MPGRPTLVVDDSTGTERDRIEGIRAERTDALVEMWTATITVNRFEWTTLLSNVDERTDRFRIERGDGSTLFEGRFADDTRDGNTVTVTVNSYEQDARDAETTGGRVVYENVSDESIVTDALNAIPTLSAGTVESGAANVSFSFAHASRAKQIRDAAEPGGMDLRYNFDRTVDFLNRLGSDKSHIAISSDEQTIIQSVEVTDDSRDPVTHVKGLGAQQGADQVVATATVPGFSGGREVWRKYPNKDIVSQDRLQTIVDRVAARFENTQREIVVEAGLVDVDVTLGDRVTVTLPEHDIDQLLRVIELTEVIGPGERLVATLSNRDPERGGDRKRRDDLQRFNSGDEGFVDRDIAPYGPEPAGDGNPREITVPNWPDDIVTEVTVDLTVQGSAWRSPINPFEHTHDLTIDGVDQEHAHLVDFLTTSEDNADFTGVVNDSQSGGLYNIGTTWTEVDSIDVNTKTSFTLANLLFTNNDPTVTVNLRLRNTTTGEMLPDGSGFSMTAPQDQYRGATFLSSTDVNNETLVLEMETTTESEFVVATMFQSAGPHIHDVVLNDDTEQDGPGTIIETSTAEDAALPEVITSFNGNEYYPQNVDISVNGTQVDTIGGSAFSSWSETIDIRGELTPGENTITADPDSRGEVNLILTSSLFRRGREDL